MSGQIPVTLRPLHWTFAGVALAGVLLVVPLARADCTTSSDGLTKTCTGDVTGAESFNHDGESAAATYHFVFDGLTSSSMTGSSGPTLQFESSGLGSIAGSALVLTFNTDAAVPGFAIKSATGPTVQVTSGGGAGGSGGNSSGSGGKTGGEGGSGGAGGALTLTLTNTVVAASSGNAFTAHSTGGDGGNAGYGESSGGGDGHGGTGGVGGVGGTINLVLDTITIENLPSGTSTVLDVASLAGTSGTGGEGSAADYTSRGGPGGAGAAGGDVSVTVTGGLTIDGANAMGVSLTSKGNLGGNGGEGYNSLSNSGYGGTGSIGGMGGTVSLSSTDDSTLTITTSGGDGLILQSLAGDGGNGGHGDSFSGPGLGGDGGQGGTGGPVTVSLPGNTVQIKASGNTAQGLFARSYGGSGGNGGSGSSTLNKGKGGSAAGAGPGGPIEVTLNGNISTGGDESNAIIVQSVGGFAGDGGAGSGLVAYGGGSESAGAGGRVEVNWAGGPDSFIQTDGEFSDGIFGQSQGGGGGKGSKAHAIDAVAGSGSAGGNGGTVVVRSQGGRIDVDGFRSRAVVAQSIGGGGGDGGGAAGIATVGGTGGGGGSGGSVEVNNSATLHTGGPAGGTDAQGIFAQSVGGGGGAAHSSAGIGTVGGNGGVGGVGGPVTVINTADITTLGDLAEGMFAQSVGGSGGRGANTLAIGAAFSMAIGGNGGTGGTGGEVTIHDYIGPGGVKPTVKTSGDMATGIMAESVGGGGGHGGNAISASGSTGAFDVSIALGGSGGAAGDGGAVAAYFDGAISTVGDQSVGLMAMSGGGGGGSAGTTLAVAAAMDTLGLSVGGDGGGGGNGGPVTICRGTKPSGTCGDGNPTDALSIETQGDGAIGILAASDGGGGGHSGVTIAASPSPMTALDIGVGGGGGGGGSGADVYVYSSGGITTGGQAAHGILAKSAGGGGGTAYLTGAASTSGSTDINLSIGGAGGNAGGSGDVHVVSIDSITTTGSSSDGIAAISNAGSGGAGGVALAGTGVVAGNIGVAVGGAGGGGSTAGDAEIDWSGNTLTTAAAQSIGLYAHSGGGSGGRGGVDLNGELGSFGPVQISVGGKGGAGGTAGTATIMTTGDITTKGSQSPAIAASSQGGNGGRGGASLSTTGGTQDSVTVTVGGGGGTGGTADAVSVKAGGTVKTTATQSEGIFAQSQGGNGGAGGWVGEGGISTTAVEDDPTVNVAISLGGGGGKGGKAGTVDVTNNGQVITGNFGSDGLYGQSIGGSGGQGGAVYSGQANFNTQNTFDVAVTVGGDGGAGGTGNTTTVTNGDSVTTTGDNSDAIFAQSVGGNGGKGGASYNVLANITSQSKHSADYQVTVGGNGGNGNLGGSVLAENQQELSTSGTTSAGIYAQSVGGNGGAGGAGGNMLFNLGKAPANSENTINAQVTIAVGGTGGTGGDAASVTVANDAGATIATTGQTSPGVFAQSVGGGGGDGGAASGYRLSITGVCSLSGAKTFSYQCRQSNGTGSNTTYAANVNVGGSGGAGGNGGTASVTNDGAISTSGTASHAVVAQSVGGGGGTGGAASPGIAAFTSNKIAADVATALADATKLDPYSALTSWTVFSLSLGGTGGAAGAGQTVTIDNSGGISTTGEASYGILAQSVGGGGGSGGAASSAPVHSLSIGGSGNGGGDGGAVNVNGYAGSTITTQADAALGILAQSVGGGGGESGNKKSPVVNPQLNIKLGGKDGVSGNGGNVTVTNTDSRITTDGRVAAAIFAQSIGGGGGLALDGLAGAQGTLSAAGSGGASGSGGTVKVVQSGPIRTAVTATESNSTAAYGIFAQSVGGGGGYAGSVVMGSTANFTNSLPIAPDGNTDTSGNGGPVWVVASGGITTNGGASVGIFAQSVGGGGGVVGTGDSNSASGALIGNGGGSGKGGTVTVSYGAGANDTLKTSGVGAHGIFAQSMGGPGGTTTTGTQVSVTAIGSITAAGGGSHGIYAQSDGDGKGVIDITVGDGAVVNGGGKAAIPGAEDGAGVFIKGGTSNSITNNGTIEAASGIATNINGTITPDLGAGATSTLRFDNYGTVRGSILSSSSIVDLTNREHGVVDAGPRLEVNRFDNAGTLFVGGLGNVGETVLTGDLVQSQSGVLSIDLNLGSDSDRLVVGGHAEVAGTVGLTLIASAISGGVISPTGMVEVLHADDGVTLDTRARASHSAAASFDLEQPSPQSLAVAWDIDFANDDILAVANRNQKKLAMHLQELFLDGTLSNLAPAETGTLLVIDTNEDFAAGAGSLGGDIYADSQLSTLYSARGFGDDLMSCAARDGEFRFIREGQCGWAYIGGGSFDQNHNSRSTGFDEKNFRLTGGAQVELGRDFHLGFGAAYEYKTLDMDFAKSNGNLVQLGVVAKKEFGPAMLAASISGGVGWYDATRDLVTGASSDGNQTIWAISGQVRGAYNFDFGNWYVTPRVDLGIDHLSSDSVHENGAGALDLRVDGDDSTYFSLQPAVKIGGDFALGDGMLVRPELTVGLTWFVDGNQPAAHSAFRVTPPGSDGFESTAQLDRTYLDVTAGVDVFATETVSIEVKGFTSLSQNTSTYGGFATVHVAF